MTQGTRNAVTAAGIAAFLMTGRTSEAAGREAPALCLHVFNQAGVGSGSLAAAQAEADRVFGAIGVRTRWPDGPQQTEDPGLRAVHLFVVLLSHDTMSAQDDAGADENVLGAAYKAAGRAYVFSDRISTLGARTRVDASMLLGRALAHEVGHLLLPGNGHANTGIMAAGITLGPTYFQLTFTPSESRAIRRTLESKASNQVPSVER